MECFGGGREARRELEGGRFRALSFGRFVACGVRVGGRLVCWGEAPSALVTSPRGKFIDVAVAEDHVCAVRAGRALACWGYDYPEGWTGAADCDGQVDAVREVLDIIGAADVPELLVLNKLDVADGVEHLLTAYPGRRGLGRNGSRRGGPHRRDR